MQRRCLYITTINDAGKVNINIQGAGDFTRSFAVEKFMTGAGSKSIPAKEITLLPG